LRFRNAVLGKPARSGLQVVVIQAAVGVRIVRLAIPTFPFAIQLKDSERK